MAIKKIRTYYWLADSFIKRHHKLILTTSLSTLVLFFGLSLFLKYLPAPKKTIRIARVGKFSSVEIPEDIKQLISIGLIKLDEQGNIQPGIAHSWEISPDGKNYTFQLAEMTWHDNTKLKPEDIQLPFKEVTTTYPQPNTIKFELQEAFAPFLYILAQPLLKDQRYGVGPFRLQKIKINKGILQRIVLVSNQEKLIYKFYPTENSAILAFKLGEVERVDHLSYLPSELDTQPTIHVQATTDYWKIATLFFNNDDVNLNNKSIRQALAYAIKDKSFGHERAISPISKKSWAFNPNVKQYQYDLEHARKLFNDNVDNPNAFQLEIKTALQYLDIAEKIAQDWQDAFNIQVTVTVNPNLGEGYQVALIDFRPALDPDQYSMWHSTQPTNLTHYQNLKVDKLLEDGRKTLDRKLRKQIYHDFQRFLLEDSPAVFLFYPIEYSLSRNRILPF